MKCKIKKGDLVVVITGKDKGARGTVFGVDRERQRVLVEGTGIVVRHTKPSASNPEGGILKKNVGVHISNVMLVDPSSKEDDSQRWSKMSLTRIGFKFDENGDKVRYAKRSGEVIGRVR